MTTGPVADQGLRLPFQTKADKNLMHQVVFLAVNTGGPIKVSCNCLVYSPANHNGLVSRTYMGDSHDLDTARKMYNDPTYHVKPFGPEWEATW